MPSSIACDSALGLACREGACEVIGTGAGGEPCEASTNSLPYLACVAPGGVDPRCVEPFPDGAPCDRECVASLCEDSVCGAPSCE